MVNKKTRMLIALVLPILVILGAAAVYWGSEPLIRSIVVSKVKAFGVGVEPEHCDLGFGWVRLRDVRLSLDGVPGLTATVERATIDWRGLSPSRVEARGLSLSLQGSAVDLLIDGGQWAQRYAPLLSFPVVADDVKVVWSESPSALPWLTMDKGRIVPASGGAHLTSGETNVMGISVGPVGVVWETVPKTITLGFGHVDPSRALLRMDIDRSTGGAKVVLRQTALRKISLSLGVELPMGADVWVEGSAELWLGKHGFSDEIQGVAEIRLRGYVPPHPRELDGIVVGDTTVFETSFRMTAERRQVVLEKSRLVAGAFMLQGGGLIDRKGDHAQITMSMSGDIACTALVKSAVMSRLGKGWAGLVADAARRALAGSVRVAVKVSADSRKLTEAKVHHDVGFGCTVRLL
jgi:hypothetical protein